MSKSAVAGVTVATVDGESAASTAWDNEDKVTMGGRLDVVGAGGDALRAPCGVPPGDVLDFARTILWGGGDCELVKRPKEPNDPVEKLFRLFWVAEVLLELVDCDHRFRLPMPSLIPVTLSG